MKPWRRTSRSASTGSQGSCIQIVSIQSADDTSVAVTFDTPVQDDTGLGTLVINGDQMVWPGDGAPILVTAADSNTSSLHHPGETWVWTPPDPFIPGSCGPPQTGIVQPF